MKPKYLKMLAGMSATGGSQGPGVWSVYMLRCADGTLYTGIAKDALARLRRHNAGKGAAYTRTRLPAALVRREDGMTRSQALIREAAIKQLSRALKERLIDDKKPAGQA
jgi:predicted GIY-YIG superfamily endonuclease